MDIIQDVPTVSIGEAAKEVGVSVITIRRWAQAGKLPYELSPGGRYRFKLSDLKTVRPRTARGDRITINYARVSSHDQREDLVRQVQMLESGERKASSRRGEVMVQRTVTTELPVELWQFAIDTSKLVEPARVEYLNRMLASENENDLIRDLQPKYGLNKRQVNAIRSEIKGAIVSAKEAYCLDCSVVAMPHCH
jgi:excisionase family DNA binding protein